MANKQTRNAAHKYKQNAWLVWISNQLVVWWKEKKKQSTIWYNLDNCSIKFVLLAVKWRWVKQQTVVWKKWKKCSLLTWLFVWNLPLLETGDWLRDSVSTTDQIKANRMLRTSNEKWGWTNKLKWMSSIDCCCCCRFWFWKKNSTLQFLQWTVKNFKTQLNLSLAVFGGSWRSLNCKKQCRHLPACALFFLVFFYCCWWWWCCCYCCTEGSANSSSLPYCFRVSQTRY